MVNAFFNENPLRELWLDHSNNETAFQYFNPYWDGLPHDIIPWNKAPGVDVIRDTQCNPEFIRLMDNRMVQGFFRYGPKEKQDGKYDYISGKGAVLDRINRYLKTKNLECLIDAANLLRLEFTRPSLKGAFFSPEDDVYHTSMDKAKGKDKLGIIVFNEKWEIM